MFCLSHHALLDGFDTETDLSAVWQHALLLEVQQTVEHADQGTAFKLACKKAPTC